MDIIMPLKNLYRFLTTLAFIFLTTACNLPTPAQKNISIINHPSPDFKDIDISAFKNIDCTWQSENYAICNEDGIFMKMGCSSITSPDSTLGLLDPSVPIISCNNVPDSIEAIDESTEGIFDSGCSRPVLIRYVVYQEGNYRLISNLLDLIEFFAPIETADEALSFAIAATGYQPIFQFEPPPEYRYLINDLEDTHVTIMADGYEVYLFQHDLCGCGPHTTFSTPVKVGIDGSIVLNSPVPVFEDPSEDDLCVD